MKVLKEFREKDAKHAEWVKTYKALMAALQAYVKDYHKTGPSWKPGGKPVAEYKKPAAAAAVPGPPPPPPPGPPPKIDIAKESAPASQGEKGWETERA